MNFPMETKIVGLVKNSKEDGYIYGEDKNYIIPEYQREYSWGENQIESFITSLKRAIDGESVFMGTVQFAYESTNASELHIIFQSIIVFIIKHKKYIVKFKNTPPNSIAYSRLHMSIV